MNPDDVIVIQTPGGGGFGLMRMKRLALASIAGTALEYYDFAVYNTLAALVFNQLFFPSFDPLAGTMIAFIARSPSAMLSRPFGGVLFGHLGDRYGRRFVLVIDPAHDGHDDLLIGLLPTYREIGVLAPVLLVCLRFLQGMALGGEWAGAVLLSVEHGDAQQSRTQCLVCADGSVHRHAARRRRDRADPALHDRTRNCWPGAGVCRCC